MEKNSNLNATLGQLNSRLKGKVVILGIGNTLRGDDGIGSLLSKRIQGKVPYIVYDGSLCPENYLGKIIQDKPDTILMIDAVDFGGKPGEIKMLEGKDIQTVNLFTTHNASIGLAIKYLENSIKVDVIVLAIQPKALDFGEKMSPEINKTLEDLSGWFLNGKN